MTFDETRDVPTVSPVIGEGDDAHRIVRVGEYAFTAWTNDEEPRMRDMELAERLGYEHPRNIRRLIAKLANDGKMPDIHVRSRAERTSMPKGGERDVAVKEYWLTEAEVLYIAAKSETAEADALLREVIRVYLLARKGLLPQTGDTDRRLTGTTLAMLSSLSAQFAALSDRFLAMEAKGSGVAAGASGARWISRGLSHYGKLMSTDAAKDYRSWRKSGDVELRAHVDHNGAASAWADLPADRYARARVKLAAMIQRAEKTAARKQMDLIPTTAAPPPPHPLPPAAPN